MNKLDVCGLSCPLPVLKVSEAIKAGQLPVTVVTEPGAPRENIKRLAATNKLQVRETAREDGIYVLELSRA
ncbi:MAG: preprotein translocase subunit TatB [Firmicutes bacterium]|nr:preprotein translocase subunit TatB [Bacillota bacterium]